jgi:hypothetical protein
MPKAYTQWTPLPHGALEKHEDNLWSVQGSIAGAPIRRVMTLARLRDGRVVVHSAVALSENEMKEIEAWGRPSFLIVPNAAHRLDARVYKDRYPQMTVICPAGAKKKVEEVVPVDAVQLDADDTVRYRSFAGTLDRDGVLEVRSGDAVSLVINDIVMNTRSLPGFGGFLMRLVGFTGPTPKVAPLAKILLVKDKPALRADLEQLAGTPNLRRAILSHGEIIGGDVGAQLRTAAAFL